MVPYRLDSVRGLLGKALLIEFHYFPRSFDERLRAFALASFAKEAGAEVKIKGFDCDLIKSTEGRADLYLARPKGLEFKPKAPFVLDVPSMPLWVGENALRHLAYHVYSRKATKVITQSAEASELLKREFVKAEPIPFQPPEELLSGIKEGKLACAWFPNKHEIEKIERAALLAKMRNSVIILGTKSRVLRSVEINSIKDLKLYLSLCRTIISLREDIGPLPPYSDKPERTLARALGKGLISDDCIKPEPLEEALKEAMNSSCEGEYPKAMEGFWKEVLS